jgi:hypothetical protein
LDSEKPISYILIPTCFLGEEEPAAADPTYDPFDFQSFQNPDLPTHKTPTHKTTTGRTPITTAPTDLEPVEMPRTTSTFPSVDQAPSIPTKTEMTTQEKEFEIPGKPPTKTKENIQK